MSIIYAIIGFISGVLGGMGMGGGTLLVPFLDLLKVGQHSAQAINLVSFIPMALVSLIIHIKNGLVEKKGIFRLVISALIFAVIGAICALVVKGKILKKSFGGFLIFLSIFSLCNSKSKIDSKSLKKSKKIKKKNF